MNFQQLRIIRETVRKNFNLTEVANTLFTSQSGVSKHILDLEDELGVELFIRKGKRLLGLTEPGQELLQMVERILLESNNIKQLGKQFSDSDKGQLTIATTHTQARYALPKVVSEFKKKYPNVHLALHQGSPTEIVQMLIEGKADFGIATESLDQYPELITFPYYSWHHAIIAPKNHALTKLKKINLENLSEYPIVTYHEGFTGRKSIDEAFLTANITPDIVMSALDADVIKTYVELGLGVGIIASMAYQAERDKNLVLLNSTHLFPTNTTKIALRRGYFLRGFAHDFIELCSPELTKENLKLALHPVLDSYID
ncbi:CysB family HTH-type transcriptional regulator [Polynucleobacter kasalickyi]|uniref:LysR family transcriptional regulator, cys regulon transcriptional activator n=1 Tax=Polynucleobacter kasalickyi TaxID=1938817 RepID=A0A1W2A516_9BURK|nr:CysB family HTH-type transcriptional regulator [Polynucleobacter kasalickyi]SMC55736.1 LysR family transcriptional regulator, cys regulon transcriptional activator [Polynucleobacter kasalickyi]